MRKLTMATAILPLFIAAGSAAQAPETSNLGGPQLGGSLGVGAQNVSPQGQVLAAIGNVKFEATGDKNYDAAPAWIRQPSTRFVGSVYPTQALRDRRNGMAVSTCVLTVDGALSGCRITREEPAGAGFGAAALTLAPSLNIKPAMKGGRPVATEITFTTDLAPPPQRAGTYSNKIDTSGMQKMLTAPVWERAPTYNEVLAVYPSRARTEAKGGRVSLSCTFGSDGAFVTCTPINEEPIGYGFADAAIELAQKFAVAPTLKDGTSVAGLAYTVPFTFSARMLQPGQMVTGQPDLVGIPSNVDLGAAFPLTARRAGVSRSRVAMACTVAANGALTNCGVTTEMPAGYGLANGAMRLAPKYKVSLWSSDGLPVAGSRVRVPLEYNLTVR